MWHKLTAAVIRSMLDTYGLDNLIYININNNRRLIIDDTNRDNLTFDDGNEILIENNIKTTLNEMQNYVPKILVSVTAYEFIESLHFVIDEKDKLKYDKTALVAPTVTVKVNE